MGNLFGRSGVELVFNGMMRGPRRFVARVPRLTNAAVIEQVCQKILIPPAEVSIDWNEAGTAGVIYRAPLTRIGEVHAGG